jgi:hypothetical protein
MAFGFDYLLGTATTVVVVVVTTTSPPVSYSSSPFLFYTLWYHEH